MNSPRGERTNQDGTQGLVKRSRGNTDGAISCANGPIITTDLGAANLHLVHV